MARGSVALLARGLALGLVLARAACFHVAWNSPWPTQCGDNFSVASDAITKWGVRTNAGNALGSRIWGQNRVSAHGKECARTFYPGI